LYLKGIKIEGPPHKPKEQVAIPGYLAITWENSGETPARKAAFYVESCTRPGWPREDFRFPYTKKDGRPQSLIPPKGTVKTVIKLDPDILCNVEREKSNMIVYGTVTYTDIFDQVHKSEFCRQWNGYTTNDTTGIIEDNQWDNCQQHNCHDDDCPQQWGKPGVGCCS
jgi:hypothetical protein